jgi:drug/metabolite transporter (DMT)-like permease
MTGRQILNRNSYVIVSGLVVVVAASFVARSDSLLAWVAWIIVAAALYAGYRLLRPGKGSRMTKTELEHLVGSGTPVMLELFSNY